MTEPMLGNESMTALQREIVRMDRYYMEIIKPFYVERAMMLERIKAEMKVGKMFQDSDDGTVFEIVQPKGIYVEFRDRSWNRTRRAYLGEKRADLSLKRAREAGFKLGSNQTDVIEIPATP